jgi:hypothetical protein
MHSFGAVCSVFRAARVCDCCTKVDMQMLDCEKIDGGRVFCSNCFSRSRAHGATAPLFERASAVRFPMSQ